MDPQDPDEVKFDDVLDKFEQSLGLAKPHLVGEAPCLKYLAMTQEEVDRLDAPELDLAALQLTNYAFHLTRAANRVRAKLEWVRARMLNNAATRLSQYQYYEKDAKLVMALRDDDVGQRLLMLSTLLKAKLDRVDYLPMKLAASADKLSNLARSKRSRYD